MYYNGKESGRFDVKPLDSLFCSVPLIISYFIKAVSVKKQCSLDF